MIPSSSVRELLRIHGRIESQPASDWKGPFPLPSTLEAFYREVGPADVYIRGYGNDYFLPCLSSLWQFQAGYRWDGITGAKNGQWNDDWIVVGDERGDPFILSCSSERVLFALHGTGEWEPYELFSELNEMAGCLAVLGEIAARAGLSFTDEDGYIRSVHVTTANAKLQELLGSEEAAQSTLRVLGWMP